MAHDPATFCEELADLIDRHCDDVVQVEAFTREQWMILHFGDGCELLVEVSDHG